ncbi:hypothetical protein DICVIV_14106 [Dictyocaulus viviparus]|uniref:Uncharacterized protein n=1 Tax=Dictyocaulus viviparus TaxID=29172 RepID=A0A0D8X656_DICVI|nr:hypothetical protein DICVIV_14106 [Dictyocaulus viviparus]
MKPVLKHQKEKNKTKGYSTKSTSEKRSVKDKAYRNVKHRGSLTNDENSTTFSNDIMCEAIQMNIHFVRFPLLLKLN